MFKMSTKGSGTPVPLTVVTSPAKSRTSGFRNGVSGAQLAGWEPADGGSRRPGVGGEGVVGLPLRVVVPIGRLVGPIPDDAEPAVVARRDPGEEVEVRHPAAPAGVGHLDRTRPRLALGRGVGVEDVLIV